MTLRTVVVLAALAVGAAGCATSSQPPAEGPACAASPFEDAAIRILNPADDPIVDDRDLAYDFNATNVRTCSLPAIGHDVLQASGVPHKYLGEIDMRGDLGIGAVAVVGSGEPGGVYVVSIENRSDPAVLAFIPQPGLHVTDVKLSDDGKVLYTASQLALTGGPTPSGPQPVAPAGFTAYDVTTPSAPAYLGTVYDANYGCHMLEPVQVADNQDAVFCISQHVRSYLVQRDNGVLLNLGFVDYMPSKDGRPMVPGELRGPTGLPVSDPTCALPAPAPEPGLCLLADTPHDVTVYYENGDFNAGPSYAVVSHWGEGVRLVDITNAPQVTELGAWDGEGATHYAGNVHTAMMVKAEGHLYILATPELTFDGVIPGLWVLDADDMGNLELVAEWYHPGNHTSQGLYLTTHQWQVAPQGTDIPADDVRIYLTYNHAGVWVLDFGAILRGDDAGAVLGYNLARTPLDPDNSVGNAVLSTWDVNVVDGYLYGSDRATGLWVFHYDGDTLGDERLRGYA